MPVLAERSARCTAADGTKVENRVQKALSASTLEDATREADALTPVIDMPVHLRWLTARIEDLGGTLTRMNLSALPGDGSLVVNATGLGARHFATAGRHTMSWELPGGAPGRVEIEFRVRPGYQPPGEGRKLGVAVISFGFPAGERT